MLHFDPAWQEYFEIILVSQWGPLFRNSFRTDTFGSLNTARFCFHKILENEMCSSRKWLKRAQVYSVELGRYVFVPVQLCNYTWFPDSICITFSAIFFFSLSPTANVERSMTHWIHNVQKKEIEVMGIRSNKRWCNEEASGKEKIQKIRERKSGKMHILFSLHPYLKTTSWKKEYVWNKNVTLGVHGEEQVQMLLKEAFMPFHYLN